VDGRPVGFSEFVFGAAPLWDVKRVELFRSPQTTTQGRNSIAGAVFIETNEPSFRWETRGRLIAGSEDLVQRSAVVSGPLVADQLAFRVAADFSDGRASSQIADFIPDGDPNEESHALLRIKLRAEPHWLPDARLELTYSHAESQAPQIEGVRPPFEERRDPSPGYGAFRTTVDSATAVLKWRPTPNAQATTTVTHGASQIERLARPGAGRARTHTRDVSAESVIQWRPAQTVRLVGGFHLLDVNLRQELDVAGSIGTGTFTDDQGSLGIFGEVEVRAVPQLELSAGLRYQHDQQARIGSIGNERRRFGIDFDEAFEAWLPKVTLTYIPSEDLRIGALVQRAYNPGGATIRLDNGATDTFGAETLWAYELFGRASLMGGRLTARANLFYNDIKNAQRPQVRTIFFPDGTGVLTTDIDNAPAAETYGAEIDIGWRPSRRLSVQAGIGLLRTETLETVDPADPILGREFQRSPHLSATFLIDWRPIDALRFSLQARHNQGYFSDDVNSQERRVRGATVLNGRAAWTTGPLTLFAYLRNLTDEFRLTYLFSPSLGTAVDPRQIGVGIDARF
jgi:outer membrane receptor protein involved in Fe transport